MLKATLYELALGTASPDAMAEFYARALGYTFADDARGLIGRARDRRLRLVESEPRTLAYAAYAVTSSSELDGLRRRAAVAGCSVEESDWPGFAARAVKIADPDGNLFVFGVPARSVTANELGSDVGARPARIQHVVFASTAPARLVAFYLDVLGFVLSDEVRDENGGLRTAFVRCSEEHHSLAVFQAAENRLDHHCMEAGDWGLIRDWADHFAAERIPLKWGPGRHGPGNNLFIFIHDPDGNWVELSAELESVEPDRPVGQWPHEERTLNSWGQGLLRS